MNSWGRNLFLALVLGAICQSPVHAAVTFSFTYFDVTTSTGLGFDDPTLGAARIASLEATAALIGSRIGQTATVEIGVVPSGTDAMGPIGLGGATFLDTSDGIRDGEVYRRIVLGEPDTTPMDLDGGLFFNFGYPVALSGAPAFDETFFPDVVRHELTHILGYGSFIDADNMGFNNTSPTDMYTRFDSFVTTDAGGVPGLPVVDAAGTQLLDETTFDFAYATGLVFDGPATRAANGGLPLKLFLSDPTHSGTASDVMFPSPATGFERLDWSPADIGVLTDLGYEIVPEPTSLALLAGLLAMLGPWRPRRGA